MSEYYPPKHGSRSFNCPFCHVYANHQWYPIALYDPIQQQLQQQLKTGIYIPEQYSLKIAEVKISFCINCNEALFWLAENIIYPPIGTAPSANSDLPDTVKELYDEAASIANQSPRAASALLRLAVEMLLKHLGETGSINDAIKNLVANGLDPKIQQSLDILRVTGNNAVHPGVVDFSDITDVQVLFQLINIIADTLITQPKQIQKTYENLPEDARKAIEKRDGQTP